MKSKDLGRNGSPFEILIISHPYCIDPNEKKSLFTSSAEKERAIEKNKCCFQYFFYKVSEQIEVVEWSMDILKFFNIVNW